MIATIVQHRFGIGDTVFFLEKDIRYKMVPCTFCGGAGEVLTIAGQKKKCPHCENGEIRYSNDGECVGLKVNSYKVLEIDIELRTLGDGKLFTHVKYNLQQMVDRMVALEDWQGSADYLNPTDIVFASKEKAEAYLATVDQEKYKEEDI